MAAETTFIGLKGGTTKVVPNLRPEELKKVKEDPNIKSVETSKGQRIKEETGVGDVQRLRTMAIEVGKTLVKALKQTGDEISKATLRDRTGNSFKIYVTYITNHDDEFEFKVSDDSKLHLINGGKDITLVDVGEESGNLKIEKAVLEDVLEKYLKELQDEIGKPEEVNNIPQPEGIKESEIQTPKGLDRLHKIVVPVEQADEALELLLPVFEDRFLPLNPPGTFYFGKRSEATEAGKILQEKGIQVEGKDIEENSEMGNTFSIQSQETGFEGKESEASDTIVLDIPLFIRILEYVREEVEDDVKIHTITQQAIRVGQRGAKTLTMDEYSVLVKESK